MAANGYILVAKGQYLAAKCLLYVVVKGSGYQVLLILGVLESNGKVNAKVEQTLCDGKGRQLRLSFWGDIEEIEVAAPVINVEELLVQAFTMDIFRFSGATANHLPELNLGFNLFEEDQVEDVRNINASVHHIYGNHNLWHLPTYPKTVDEILSLRNLVINEDAEVAAVLWILFVETVNNLDGVFMFVGKDDGLSDGIAAIDREARCH